MNRTEWVDAFNKLPNDSEKLPVVFFPHGSPLLLHQNIRMPMPNDFAGFKDGLNAQWLHDFGKKINDMNPTAIIIFSAHWEEDYEVKIMSRDTNELYYDYYGFDQSLYNLDFSTKGSPQLASRILEHLKKQDIKASLDTKRGLDHGVFVPLMIMFPQENPLKVPLIEISLHPQTDNADLQLKLGKAISSFRDQERVLILSGGLTSHNFRNWQAWAQSTASAIVQDWQVAIDAAALTEDEAERAKKLKDLMNMEGYHACHHSADHFVPLYVAAGAGGKSLLLSSTFGHKAYAFGL